MGNWTRRSLIVWNCFLTIFQKMVLVDCEGEISNYQLFKSFAVFDRWRRQSKFRQSWKPISVIETVYKKIRDGNTHRRPERFSYDYEVVWVAVIEKPVTYDEPMISDDTIFCKNGMDEEIIPLENNLTWNLMPFPLKPDGSIDRFKARLSEKGYFRRN